MTTFNQSFAAGDNKRFSVKGGFFRLLSLSENSPVNIGVFSVKTGETEKIENVVSGIAVTMPIDFVEIYSPVAQDIQFIITSARVEYDRPDVTINNDVLNSVNVELANGVAINTASPVPEVRHYAITASVAVAIATTILSGTFRYVLHIRNAGASSVWISTDSAIIGGFDTSHPGFLIPAGGEETLPYPIYGGAFYAICSTGQTTSLVVSETTL